ncbi:uncharacterized protein LOC121915901 [Sceloporus undulatus]|uniref:uncharacterized protein LOC121915901 n=1 Tax=Sceloporus undulatus TaxID=8520 RepID=UPI001C4C8F7F|nr:uncharacterized protein LOC121915901 [Sceloporus undulatus]
MEQLSEAITEQLLSPEEQTHPASPAQKEEAKIKSKSTQRDLRKTWEELESLKDKFSRLQEDYSDTRLTNQLLEEKLQIIAQSMAEERQTLNQRINELLERLISAQNTICTLEKINISGLVSKSMVKHQHMEKSESPDSLCSLHNLDVAPPPAFMDGASDARTTPSQSDSANEASKLGASSESDTSGPNGERLPSVDYKSLVPSSEGLKRHSKGHARATAFTPWKQKSTRFSTEPVNSTESECSGEEMVPVCPLPTPRFLYLRQETLVAPTGSSGFPSLPTTEPVVFEVERSTSPPGLPLSSQLELVPELSSSESSDDEDEVSWSPGLVEKTSSSHLDYESAQKMLDSLLHKNPEPEKSREKEAHKAGRPGGYRLAGYQEGSGSGLGPGRHLHHHHHHQQQQQHQVRYYQDFPSPGQALLEEKSYPCPPPLPLPRGVGSLPRGIKGVAMGLEGDEAAQDSTSL